MSLIELGEMIVNREAALAVIGLGYVGIPVACALAQAGFRVIGVDIRQRVVDAINAGRSPVEGDEPGLNELVAQVVASRRLHATADYSWLSAADIILVCVETPVDDNHRPGYAALRAVCQSLGPVLKPGALVIIESTVAPGTTNGLVASLLEESSGRRAGVDFYLGVCPERVMPGKLLANLRTMSRVCGGLTPETATTMQSLYRQFVQGELDAVDTVTAEIVKTAENAYRDVQIAFANEVALICEAAGADVWQVRELVNKSPQRHMHLPGAGVGGHCIPKDPWLLAHAAAGRVPLRLIPAARAVNEGMPLHVAGLVEEALGELGAALSAARIAILGYAYLEDSDDTRNSPSAILAARLRELGAEVVIHDPWVKEHQGDMINKVAGCDAIVLMVKHRAYHDLDLRLLGPIMRRPVAVDGRHVIDQEDARAAGWVYRAVGQGANAAYPSGRR
jgi:UDP-N-acetyl-D-mannosaminuronic acid dehydrogenase